MVRFLLLPIFVLAALIGQARAEPFQGVVPMCGDPPAPCTATNPFPTGGGTAPSPLGVTPTDKGGTITLGGTSQTLAVANASRKAIIIENPCTTTGQGSIAAVEDLYISVVGNATVGGAGNYADLGPCGSTTITVSGQVFTGLVRVNAATTGHRWSATEW